MQDPLFYLIMAATGLAALVILVTAGLRGWTGWLDLKRAEMAGRPDGSSPLPATMRIEIADLKERIRKLEAIAAGVDI